MRAGRARQCGALGHSVCRVLPRRRSPAGAWRSKASMGAANPRPPRRRGQESRVHQGPAAPPRRGPKAKKSAKQGAARPAAAHCSTQRGHHLAWRTARPSAWRRRHLPRDAAGRRRAAGGTHTGQTGAAARAKSARARPSGRPWSWHTQGADERISSPGSGRRREPGGRGKSSAPGAHHRRSAETQRPHMDDEEHKGERSHRGSFPPRGPLRSCRSSDDSSTVCRHGSSHWGRQVRCRRSSPGRHSVGHCVTGPGNCPGAALDWGDEETNRVIRARSRAPLDCMASTCSTWSIPAGRKGPHCFGMPDVPVSTRGAEAPAASRLGLPGDDEVWVLGHGCELLMPRWCRRPVVGHRRRRRRTPIAANEKCSARR